MMVQNVTFCGLVLSVLAVVVKMRRIYCGRKKKRSVVEVPLPIEGEVKAD